VLLALVVNRPAVFSEQLLSEKRNSCYNFAMTAPIDKSRATMAHESAAQPRAQVVRRHDDLNPPPSAKRKKSGGGSAEAIEKARFGQGNPRVFL
jgi:hypothetical protein